MWERWEGREGREGRLLLSDHELLSETKNVLVYTETWNEKTLH